MAKDLTLRTELHKGDLRKMSQDIRKVGSLQGIDPATLRKRFRQPLGKIKGDLGEFQKSMEASNARVIAFGASTALIAGVATALKGAAKAAIDVERSLADINVILNASSKNLNNFGQSLFKIAKDTGQTFQVVAEAAGELARQGLGMQDTLQRTSDALILARLSGMDTVDAVNSLTAAVNSFSKSALNSTEIVNKLANVDAAFAVSSADLAEAIKRVGSSASDAGVSMDELIAIVTTAQQTTARGGAVIGNSFKTIFTRLQRPAVLQQLEALGIATKDASGNILPLMGVIKGLAMTFDKLEDVQKSQIAELVGGVFQVNVLKAALSDLGQEYSVYGRALETSISSTDEAIRRNEQLNQTLSALINTTFVNLQNVGAQVGDIGFAPNAKGIMKTINSSLEAVDLNAGEDMGNKLAKGIIKGLGNFFLGGPGLMLGALGIAKLFTNLKTFALDAFKGITGLNQGAKRRADTETRIKDLLMSEDRVLDRIASDTLTVDQAARDVLETYRLQEKVLKRVADISGGVASKIGGRISSKGGGKASGFIPNFSGKAEERLAMLAAGYNPSDVRNASVRKTTIHNGSGGSFSSFVNSKETVRTGTNAQGYKATFVVPPKGSSAFGNYIKNIPNFAKGQRLFGPQDFAETPSKDFQDFLDRHQGGRWKLNRAGVGIGKSKSAFNLFKGLSPERQKASRPAHMKYSGPLKTTADVFKKYGVSQMNISAMAFPDVKGKKNKGLLNFVGTPFDANMFDKSFQRSYPSFLKGVGKGSMKTNADPALVKHFLDNLRVVAMDPQGSAQVRGRVHETLASALLVDPKQMGNKLVDVGKGAQIDPKLKPLLSKSFIKGLASGGVELKGGGFRMSNIFGKFGFEGEKHKSFLDDLRRVGVDVSPTGPYAETVIRGEKRRAAAGFIPNFSARGRAMATERAMGGSPEYRDFPFPHIADKKTQRVFGDILRDHPEGLKKAIGNSFAAQGIPNFAKKRKPISTDEDYKGMFGADLGGFFNSMKGKLRGKDAMAAEAEPKAYQAIADEISKLEEALQSHQKALEETSDDIRKSNRGEETPLNKGASMKKGSKTVWKKSSKQYQDAMALQGSQVDAVKAAKKDMLLQKVKAKKMEEASAQRASRGQMGEKIRSKAFSAAFLLPTIAGPLTEMLPVSDEARKGLDAFTTGLSSAATAVTMLPPGVGLAAGALIALGTSAGAFTNWFAHVGGDLGKRKDQLKESLQTMQDASSRFFDVSSKLDSAITSGAAGDTLTRLGNKLEETLSQLDPAQQALLTSSLSLAEKQDAMAKIIDENGRQLKQMGQAKNIADSINEARGMGVGSFFKGVGNLFGEGGFRAGANDVNAITAQNVKGMTQGIFATVGSKDLKEMLKDTASGTPWGEGGLSKGKLISSLEGAGVDSDLIAMLKELNKKGLEDLRQGLVRTTKEAERNAKVAEANVKVQKMYNRLIGEATKAVQSASDHLLNMQKRLVENFVFHREMKSGKIFNQIDISIAKFDALYGAAAQNLNAFEKADINFRKKKLNAEVAFQKQITTNQNAFIKSAADITAIDTSVVQEKTDKKIALRRSQKQIDRSIQFTNILEKFDKTQNIEQFNNSIKDLLVTQGDSSQKAVDKLESAFAKFNQTSATQLEEQRKATEIAREVREIEKNQAELLRGGGVKVLIDPNSFVDLRSKMVDSMEDIFLGSGGSRGGLGENNQQAGSGFLNLLKSLRTQGFDTGAFADNNPALKRRAVAARYGQNLAIAEDLRLLANTMGDPALAMMAKQVADPALAAKQVGDFLDPGKRLREEQAVQRKLLTDQGDIFKTGINRIEGIIDRNLQKQAETFKNLDAAAIDLEEASHALHRIEILRQFDTTSARLRREASEQKKKDAASAGSAAAGAVAGEFGDYAGATKVNPMGLVGLMAGVDGGNPALKRILKAFGQDTGTSLASWQSADEQLFTRIMERVIGDKPGRFGMAFGEVSAGMKDSSVSQIGTSGAGLDFVTHLVNKLERSGALQQGAGTESLVKDMHKMLFSVEHATGKSGNFIKTLERVASDGNASAKNQLDALKDIRAANIENTAATREQTSLEDKGQKALDNSVAEAQRFGIDTGVQKKLDTYIHEASRDAVRAGEAKTIKDAFDVNVNVFTGKIDTAVMPFVDALKNPLKVDFGEHVIKIDTSQALLEGIRLQIANATPQALLDALRQSGMTTDIDLLKKQMKALKKVQTGTVQNAMGAGGSASP